jgi:hypothetical protein
MESQNVNLETMCTAEKGILLGNLYEQAFQVQQNIAAVRNSLQKDLPTANVITSPNCDISKTPIDGKTETE